MTIYTIICCSLSNAFSPSGHKVTNVDVADEGLGTHALLHLGGTHALRNAQRGLLNASNQAIAKVALLRPLRGAHHHTLLSGHAAVQDHHHASRFEPEKQEQPCTGRWTSM